jgi:hypothetical protein
MFTTWEQVVRKPCIASILNLKKKGSKLKEKWNIKALKTKTKIFFKTYYSILNTNRPLKTVSIGPNLSS